MPIAATATLMTEKMTWYEYDSTSRSGVPRTPQMAPAQKVRATK